MKVFLIISLLFLLSCSGNLVREPATRNQFNCQDELTAFYSKENLSKNVAINSERLLYEASQYEQESEEVKVAFNLIKKKYPDFTDDQIIAHFNLLSSTCHKF